MHVYIYTSCAVVVISSEEERKITAVEKLFGGFRGGFGGSRGGGGSSGGSARGGGASVPRSSGNGHRTSSGKMIPAVVAGSAGSAHARSNERKNNAIGHAQLTHISLATAILCFTILLFV